MPFRPCMYVHVVTQFTSVLKRLTTLVTSKPFQLASSTFPHHMSVQISFAYKRRLAPLTYMVTLAVVCLHMTFVIRFTETDHCTCSARIFSDLFVSSLMLAEGDGVDSLPADLAPAKMERCLPKRHAMKAE